MSLTAKEFAEQACTRYNWSLVHNITTDEFHPWMDDPYGNREEKYEEWEWAEFQLTQHHHMLVLDGATLRYFTVVHRWHDTRNYFDAERRRYCTRFEPNEDFLSHDQVEEKDMLDYPGWKDEVRYYNYDDPWPVPFNYYWPEEMQDDISILLYYQAVRYWGEEEMKQEGIACNYKQTP